MQPPVIAALITASVSLILAAGKIVWDWREKKHERRLAARERLDKYRAPLLAAVDDLGRRLDNIRNGGFLTYLDLKDRQSIALHSTLFRFAQYLGWIEIIYGYSDRLRFESDLATKSVTDTIGDIGWIMAADEFDRVDEDVFTTSQLMLWREEQRAIGELMLHEGDEPRCISFNSFVTNYDERFSRWFATFAAQLTPSASETNRLAELHRALVRLLRQLDVDQILLEFDEDKRLVKPLWAQPLKLAEPTKHTGRKDIDNRPKPQPGQR
jgi:hypothetical protein